MQKRCWGYEYILPYASHIYNFDCIRWSSKHRITLIVCFVIILAAPDMLAEDWATIRQISGGFDEFLAHSQAQTLVFAVLHRLLILRQTFVGDQLIKTTGDSVKRNSILWIHLIFNLNELYCVNIPICIVFVKSLSLFRWTKVVLIVTLFRLSL